MVRRRVNSASGRHQFHRLVLDVAFFEFDGVLLRLPRVDDFVTHQSNSVDAFSTPSALAC